jgi:hypothetical protein
MLFVFLVPAYYHSIMWMLVNKGLVPNIIFGYFT